MKLSGKSELMSVLNKYNFSFSKSLMRIQMYWKWDREQELLQENFV